MNSALRQWIVDDILRQRKSGHIVDRLAARMGRSAFVWRLRCRFQDNGEKIDHDFNKIAYYVSKGHLFDPGERCQWVLSICPQVATNTNPGEVQGKS